MEKLQYLVKNSAILHLKTCKILASLYKMQIKIALFAKIRLFSPKDWRLLAVSLDFRRLWW